MCDDLVGDLDLAAHGVNGHERSLELTGCGQLIEELRNCSDFVGLLGNAKLSQDQSSIDRVGTQRVEGLALCAYRGYAARSCRRWRSNRVGPAIAPPPKFSKQRANRVGSTRLKGSAASAHTGYRDGSRRTGAGNRDYALPTRRSRRSRHRRRSSRRSHSSTSLSGYITRQGSRPSSRSEKCCKRSAKPRPRRVLLRSS